MLEIGKGPGLPRMRQSLIRGAAILFSGMLAASPVFAGGGGSHGGGFHGGEFHEHGFHGGEFREHGFHGGHFFAGGFGGHRFHHGHFFGGFYPGFGLGVALGLGYPWGGYYYPPYNGYYGTATPYSGYYGTALPYGAPQYWYYCANPSGYYPYVTQCYSGWQTVPAS